MLVDNGHNGNGAIAFELKWRNAGHASEQAFENANPDSAVGLLSTLRDAAQATEDAYAEAGVDPDDELRTPEDIQFDIDAISGEDGELGAVQADIDALDPESETYEGDLAALTAELGGLETELTQLEVELVLPETLEDTDAAEEEAADAVGLDDLSEEALAALWDLLDK